MAFPALSFSLGSEEAVKDGVIVDRAMNGTAKGRNLFTTKKRSFSLRFTATTAANKATLEAYYDANRATVVAIPWTDAVTRNCIMTGIKFAPGPNLPSGRRWDVIITVEEV